MNGCIHVLSGVALILFGVRLLRDGLAAIFGSRLNGLVERLAEAPARAFATGLGIGAAVPSSTSISLLVMHAFQTSRITPLQVFPLVLGADIGVTALVFISSLHVENAAPVLIVIGVILYQFMRSDRSRGLGQMFVGLAMVMLALTTFGALSASAERDPDMVTIIAIFEHYPLAVALLAGGMAVVLQSSTATILMFAGLDAGGSVGMSQMLLIVVAANLGIAVTRMMVGWSIAAARRLSCATAINRAMVATLLLLFSRQILEALGELPGGPALHIAMVHLGFNLTAAVMGFLFGGVWLVITDRLVPESAAGPADSFGPCFIDFNATTAPVLALGQSQREILRAADIVREMLADLWKAMERGDEALASAVRGRDDEVDLLDREVKRFLCRINHDQLDPTSADEQMRQLRFLSQIEEIGDILDKNLAELVLKKLHNGMQFSLESWNDLQDFEHKVQENLRIAEIAFQTRNPNLAAQLLRHKEWLNQYHRYLADRQLARLTSNPNENPDVSAVHLDVLANLKRVNSCLSHIGYAVLNAPAPWSGDAFFPFKVLPKLAGIDVPPIRPLGS